MKIPKLSESLKLGRRVIENIKGVQLLEDFVWNENRNSWILKYNFKIKSQSSFVPSSTDWYVLIENNYPIGSVKVYPAKENGLSHTFNHQFFNDSNRSDYPWTTGYLCLDTPTHTLGKQFFDEEPTDATNKLKWHIERSLEWLDNAAKNSLSNKGEPFEMPHFPHYDSLVIGFNEDTLSLAEWNKVKNNYGFVNLLNKEDNVIIVKSFFNIQGTELVNVKWGESINKSEANMLGLWIKIDSVPIIPPWQAPFNWEELSQALKAQNIDMYYLLDTLSTHFRDNNSHYLLLGFPIPDKVEGEEKCMFWQSIKIPPLATRENPPFGFRSVELSLRLYDRNFVWNRTHDIKWINTNNWSMEEISTRGKLPDNLKSKNILLIGAGALGSILAELLVRAGVNNISIMDSDDIEMGNLVRHTLTIQDIGKNKATCLAQRLNLISPHTSARPLKHKFPPTEQNDIELIQKADIIIDSTGENELIKSLGQFKWINPKLFFSFSFGLNAKQLYCFFGHGIYFPESSFFQKITPVLKADTDNFIKKGGILPRAGIGCWHPVFPARIDDLALLTPSAIKFMEEIVEHKIQKEIFSVFSQKSNKGIFEGIERINF